jgi:hypothetical protein
MRKVNQKTMVMPVILSYTKEVGNNVFTFTVDIVILQLQDAVKAFSKILRS